MNQQDNHNKHKTKLLIITLIAIIAVLLVGIIYQFVTIKKLKDSLPNTTAIVKVVNKDIY